mmetsp:Transcript_76522/g.120828  ORF Transcript_76522/g.120828 Transcript_76522/m.120828 type:complete len:751 (+) Transcript_76522:123-2375(+)
MSRSAPPPLALSRAALLKKCVQVIDGFDPKKTTIDAWVQDAEVLKDKNIGEVEYKFIHQVVYGCNRYQKFLKLFVTSFFYQSATCAIRSEQTVYTVLAYLLFFRLEELGLDEFEALIQSGAATLTALHAMMQYAMNVEELNRWVKVEWCKLYDKTYIEEEVIGKLQALADELRPMLEDLELKATGTLVTSDGTTLKAPPKKLTKPVAPNITKPKPRLIPEPEAISREIKAKPVPEHIINGTSLAEVEREKAQRREQHRQEIASKYTHEVLLETAKRNDGTEIEELTRKVEEERMKECTFRPVAAKPYVPPTEEACVRQNVASVLREDALLKKKQANEYNALKRYEEDLHDASDYYRWQHEAKLKDQEEEEKRVQQRIVEMQLAREEAMEAFEGMVRRKHILAENQREEIAKGIEIRDQEQEALLQGKQELVKQFIGERENARLEEAKILAARQENVEKIKEEKKAEKERKEREDAHEMERKKDLIRQIRALERVPVERFTKFDPAEQPCQGLLEEMSLAELRERLSLEKGKRVKELEEKKERQLQQKHEKQLEFAEKAQTLAKIRDIAKQESSQRHQVMKDKKKEAEERQLRHREQCVVEASEKIAQKKKERRDEELRLKRELKEISTKKQFLAANAEMLEAKAHAAQQAGLEREAMIRQRRTLVDQKKLNDIKMKDANVRRENRARSQDAYETMKAAVTQRIERAKADDEALKRSILLATTSAKAAHLRSTARSASRRPNETTQMSVSV